VIFPEGETMQNVWYAKLAMEEIDKALASEDPAQHLHSLKVIKDYVWYLVPLE
jgi:recombinational DNA repair protein (RecF pathway)